ncbi:glucokinase [Psychromonas arctica]|uniref:glucokinase n=1 Tax=Psychromonas arctica TaxID=168275 RepID=UPI0003F76957|nr:glucokinase [Psychromonas arctica]
MLSVVADVGGTNIRLAVLDIANGEMSKVREYPCAQFITLESALVQYFATLSDPVSHLCVGIACPVEDDLVSMTNLSWQFSKSELQQKLALKTLYVINDYTAISLAVPFVEDKQKIQIGGGVEVTNAVKAIFGPGTGLGVSHLIKHDQKWVSLDGEGGHTSFAPNTSQQADVLLLLQGQFGHVSNERLLSGQGLVNIYHALCRLAGKQPEFFEPAEITKSALADECEIAVQTLTLFCQAMGGFAGNLALNLDCKGGVYIAGGIVPRFIDFFQNSEFRTFFEAKGRFSKYLKTVPTYLITHENPGLLGAAVYLRQEIA